jgi:hypothetical protein
MRRQLLKSCERFCKALTLMSSYPDERKLRFALPVNEGLSRPVGINDAQP